MSLLDYDAVIGLMTQTPGISFREADSREATARYLERNPGLSFVCEVGGELVGCIMSGHDGRRGYLQHLVVSPPHRRQGIGSQLIECCLAELEKLGIYKSHINVFKTNTSGAGYWAARGWVLRTDIHQFSRVRAGRDNA
ncbi:MAG: GNAT family N-acetyltransferase [Pseudomonadota bacterium]